MSLTRKFSGKSFLALALCMVLSACGTKEYQSTEDYVSTNDSLYESYIESIADDSSPLMEPERRALLSVGEIDKNLTLEELKWVEQEYKHYVKNSRGRVTIERFMYRAKPYLDYTKRVFRERNMPEELAYLAFVESGYHPFARSKANALGMWQFMAGTARHCNLKINWWIDERLDPYKATHAAADYLQEMYDEFGDWCLALAAYNAGPGKIRRALAETGTNDFFDLMAANEYIENSKIKIKQETAVYVPRFLAMAKIMRNFDELGFEPKEHELGKGHDVIAEKAIAIKAQKGTDLKALARELGMSWKKFRDYNPAFLQTVTPMTEEAVFYVPVSMEAKGLEISKKSVVAGWGIYVVERGDTLSGISKKTGVPVRVLRESNRISEPLQIGVQLRVPGKNTYLADKGETSKNGNDIKEKRRPEKAVNYTVQSGDTFNKIAARYGMSVAELKRANPQISNITKISRGQKIRIPAENQILLAEKADKKQQRTEKRAPQKALEQQRIYTLKKGDTLYSIAKKHGLSVAQLQAMNHSLDPRFLSVGQKLVVSGKGQGSQYAAENRQKNSQQKNEKKNEKRNTGKLTKYTVKKGDTLFSIAKKHGLSIAELQTYNKGLTTSISVGQKISVPQNSTGTQQAAKQDRVHVVKKGDTLYSIGRNYNVPVEIIVAYNKLENNSLTIGQKVRIPHLDMLAEKSR